MMTLASQHPGICMHHALRTVWLNRHHHQVRLSEALRFQYTKVPSLRSF